MQIPVTFICTPQVTGRKGHESDLAYFRGREIQSSSPRMNLSIVCDICPPPQNPSLGSAFYITPLSLFLKGIGVGRFFDQAELPLRFLTSQPRAASSRHHCLSSTKLCGRGATGSHHAQPIVSRRRPLVYQRPSIDSASTSGK